MPFFEHDGARLHYREEGSGPPLVLVHGFGSSELDWELQVPALKEHYRMIMPDLRGFGQSSKDVGPHSIEQFLSDLRALLTPDQRKALRELMSKRRQRAERRGWRRGQGRHGPGGPGHRAPRPGGPGY